MRQEFISPVFIPTITESYLRKDFDFSEYLGFCYGKTLRKFFRISIPNYFIVFLFIVGFKELLAYNKTYFIFAMFGMPVLFWITFASIAYGISRVYRKLVPSLENPESMNLHADHDIIDPFEHYDNLMPTKFIEVPETNFGIDQEYEKELARDSDDIERNTEDERERLHAK